MNTPAKPAAAHIRWKWKKPTRRRIPFQEAATAKAVRAKVNMSMIRLSPSIARWKRMPALGIQATSTRSSQRPVPGDVSPAKCFTQTERARPNPAADTASAVHLGHCSPQRPTNQAKRPPAIGIAMRSTGIIGRSPVR